jgi:hypothetical protein
VSPPAVIATPESPDDLYGHCASFNQLLDHLLTNESKFKAIQLNGQKDLTLPTARLARMIPQMAQFPDLACTMLPPFFLDPTIRSKTQFWRSAVGLSHYHRPLRQYVRLSTRNYHMRPINGSGTRSDKAIWSKRPFGHSAAVIRRRAIWCVI